MDEPSLAEVAWAGGLFEGEGTVVRQHTNRWGGWLTHLRVGMTDRDCLERFMSAVGVGKIYGPYKYQSTSSRDRSYHKPYWAWTVASKKDVRIVITLLRPWVCSRRGQALDEALDGLSRCYAPGETPIPHGTKTGYTRGCRLECCAKPQREYRRKWWVQRKLLRDIGEPI